jgi:hypothetical protein
MLQVPDAVHITIPDENVFAIGASWILVIIIGLVLIWQIIKLFLEIGERYFIVGLLTMLSPWAFAMGGSKSTEDIFKGWTRMFATMCLMMVLNVIILKLLLSAMGNMPNGVECVPWVIFVIAISRTGRKIDSLIQKIGLNPAMTGSNGRGLPGMLTMMVVRNAASKVISSTGKSGGAKNSATSGTSGVTGGGKPRTAQTGGTRSHAGASNTSTRANGGNTSSRGNSTANSTASNTSNQTPNTPNNGTAGTSGAAANSAADRTSAASTQSSHSSDASSTSSTSQTPGTAGTARQASKNSASSVVHNNGNSRYGGSRRTSAPNSANTANARGATSRFGNAGIRPVDIEGPADVEQSHNGSTIIPSTGGAIPGVPSKTQQNTVSGIAGIAAKDKAAAPRPARYSSVTQNPPGGRVTNDNAGMSGASVTPGTSRIQQGGVNVNATTHTDISAPQNNSRYDSFGNNNGARDSVTPVNANQPKPTGTAGIPSAPRPPQTSGTAGKEIRRNPAAASAPTTKGGAPTGSTTPRLASTKAASQPQTTRQGGNMQNSTANTPTAQNPATPSTPKQPPIARQSGNAQAQNQPQRHSGNTPTAPATSAPSANATPAARESASRGNDTSRATQKTAPTNQPNGSAGTGKQPSSSAKPNVPYKPKQQGNTKGAPKIGGVNNVKSNSGGKKNRKDRRKGGSNE